MPNIHNSPQITKEAKKTAHVKPKPKQKASMHPSQMAFANISKSDSSNSTEPFGTVKSTVTSSAPAGTFNKMRGAGPYKPALGPIMSFGFGGRLSTFFPGAAAGGQVPSLHQPSPEAVSRPTKPNPITVHTLNKLVTSGLSKDPIGRSNSQDIGGISSIGSSPDAVRKHEIKQVFDLVKGFGGPLASATGSEVETKQREVDDFISKCQNNPIGYTTNSLGAKNSSSPSSEKLLWSLLQILMKFEGSLSSEALVDGKDTSTPESHIVHLLMEGSTVPDSQLSNVSSSYPSESALSEDSISKQVYLNHLNSKSNSKSKQPQQNGPFVKSTSAMSTDSDAATSLEDKNSSDAAFYAKVEQLLIRGQREDACALAVDAEQWSIALMIGSMCGKETFQHMMKTLADKSFPQHSTLHLMSLLYSNQAESMVRYGGRSLAGDNHKSGGIDSSPSSWKKNLTAVVANKVGDWVSLSKAVGDRIMDSSGDIMAAHFAYLVSGMPCGKGKIVLLGCNNSDVALEGTQNSMSDLRCLSAMRMTEIYEWCLLRSCTQPATSSTKPTKKQSSSSFSSLFGFGGGSKEPEEENKDSSSETVPVVKPSVPLRKMPSEIVFKCRLALCPQKFKLAVFLADLGLAEEAAEYVRDIKEVCAKAENGGSSKPG
jgi:hypothetical protein